MFSQNFVEMIATDVTETDAARVAGIRAGSGVDLEKGGEVDRKREGQIGHERGIEIEGVKEGHHL